MLYFIDALADFFSTSVGSYWVYMYCGVGVAIAFLLIYDNLKK